MEETRLVKHHGISRYRQRDKREIDLHSRPVTFILMLSSELNSVLVFGGIKVKLQSEIYYCSLSINRGCGKLFIFCIHTRASDFIDVFWKLRVGIPRVLSAAVRACNSVTSCFLFLLTNRLQVALRVYLRDGEASASSSLPNRGIPCM